MSPQTGTALPGDAPLHREGVRVVPIDTPTLGDRSYLVHDGEVAFVVDPQRDIDRVLSLLDKYGLQLTDVFETHIHNDYVTGGLALAQQTGAAYHVNAADRVGFERMPIRDGDAVQIGARMRVTAIATPGHTLTHLSYLLVDSAAAESATVGVFSGGSLLYGATGRPDLLGPDHTNVLAQHQHASARKLVGLAPDDAGLFPTHGFGSFCSATQSDAAQSSIGREKLANPVLTQDRETYVRELLEGLDAWPAYYAEMGPRNTAGPEAPDLSLPAVADAAQLRRRITAGEWVVDLRTRSKFAAGHVPGSVNFGLDGQFATYLGWLIPTDAPITLLGATTEQVREAQRELVRIGVDRPAGHATGAPQTWTAGRLATFRRATFADLATARRRDAVAVLDVRRKRESATWIEGGLRIPLHELPARLAEIPAGETWVHCAHGYRASVAASLLDAAGIPVVAVDDSFDNARHSGLPLIGPAA